MFLKFQKTKTLIFSTHLKRAGAGFWVKMAFIGFLQIFFFQLKLCFL